jgi:hypothetical protein
VLSSGCCRSGQSVFAAVGHTKKVIKAHFSPNGWQVATGSDDHMVSRVYGFFGWFWTGM